jgi:hypothetical protein
MNIQNLFSFESPNILMLLHIKSDFVTNACVKLQSVWYKITNQLYEHLHNLIFICSIYFLTTLLVEEDLTICFISDTTRHQCRTIDVPYVSWIVLSYANIRRCLRGSNLQRWKASISKWTTRPRTRFITDFTILKYCELLRKAIRWKLFI